MRQGLLVAPHSFAVRETDRPIPGPDEVVVAVDTAGICGSDLHIYHGENPVIRPPVVMGHEFSGSIAAAGPGVDAQPGQRVIIYPLVACGKCVYCQAGQPNRCPDMRFVGAIGYDGAFAEYVLAPSAGVMALPDALSFGDGAMIEPVAFATHAAGKIPDVARAGVLVLGAGTIGNLVAQVAKAYGARHVGITDVLDGKLRTARAVGIEATCNSAKEDLEAWVKEQFGPAGPEVTFDCVALATTVKQAVRLTRRGGNVFLVGVPTGELPVPLVELLIGETSLSGVYCYVPGDFHEAIRLVLAGKVHTRPLVSATFGLDEIGEAFAYAVDRKNEAIKVAIRP